MEEGGHGRAANYPGSPAKMLLGQLHGKERPSLQLEAHSLPAAGYRLCYCSWALPLESKKPLSQILGPCPFNHTGLPRQESMASAKRHSFGIVSRPVFSFAFFSVFLPFFPLFPASLLFTESVYYPLILLCFIAGRCLIFISVDRSGIGEMYGEETMRRRRDFRRP